MFHICIQPIQWIFRASSELGIASLKLEESSQHGFYFRVTLKESAPVNKNKNYTVIDQPKTGMRYRLYCPNRFWLSDPRSDQLRIKKKFLVLGDLVIKGSEMPNYRD